MSEPCYRISYTPLAGTEILAHFRGPAAPGQNAAVTQTDETASARAGTRGAPALAVHRARSTTRPSGRGEAHSTGMAISTLALPTS